MNESMVTFQGWLGADVRLRSAAGVPVASFRVASTPRRFNRSSQEWSDGPTQWFTVTAWRALAEHCAQSLRRADPVVVHGRLSQSTWVNSEGVECTSLEVEATFVGHDLARGVSRFTRAPRRPDPVESGATPAQPAVEPALEPAGESSEEVAA